MTKLNCLKLKIVASILEIKLEMKDYKEIMFKDLAIVLFSVFLFSRK